jgi:hypothetical protein
MGNLRRRRTSTSIFKKGDAKIPNKYRFVMKLVVAEKLVLVIIGNRLHELIESVGEEYETQCGFRHQRGCIDEETHEGSASKTECVYFSKQPSLETQETPDTSNINTNVEKATNTFPSPHSSHIVEV